MVTMRNELDRSRAHTVAASVPDPELPMLTLADLGILRAVEIDGTTVVVSITPTYSGCPAMNEMSVDVDRRLQDAGFHDVIIKTVLSPPWTTEWITAEGRRKLAAAGIAPPGPARTGATSLTMSPTVTLVACPRCGSADTARLAQFGATACRALWQCASCGEPFEQVKPI